MRNVAVCISILSLAACSRAGALKPAEVLQRAALESAKLQSFAFDGSLQLAMERDGQEMMPFVGKMTMEIKGVSQDGGKQAHATVHIQGDIRSEEARHAVGGAFETFAVFNDAVYLRVSELSVEPPHPMVRQDVIETLQLGTWWKLPGGSGQTAGQQVTPDPGFVRLQAEVIAVDRDHGLETVNGRDAYHYSVHIDSDKLAAFLRRAAQEQGAQMDDASVATFLQNFGAKGNVWIDAETFHVHRISWNIRPSSMQMSTTFDLVITQHNAAPRITAPTEAEEFPEGFLPASPAIDDDMNATGGTLSP